MQIVDKFPHEVVEHENVWIPGADGAQLAARIWRPADSDRRPTPAILEYIPYRKRFGTAVRDEQTHRYLAGHGYACVRLDIRGSGESDGVLTDEYLQSELDDGVAALEWIADQTWCDGNVGMMGISWGGFNALQIAAMRPPALKAIVTVCSTDDRYADDIHHMGGALLGDNLSWASVMFSYNSMPPDPALVGDRWRKMWMERLEGSGLWLKTWLEHQRRDAYWRHGSVCEDYEAIDIPVLAASGWADGYTNAVFRLMANLKGPRKGIVGPWGHIYPQFGRPGPAIDFLGEMLRWWDRWLKGEDTGVEADPMVAAWMQDSVPPRTEYDERPGRWVTEAEWPSPRVVTQNWLLGAGRNLAPEDRPVEERTFDVQSPVSLGLASGKWCSYANAPDLAGDQRTDDGGGLVFQTEPLEEPVEIFGAPEVELDVASDQDIALVAVRLSDMRPDHQVTRISYGVLNLTHRDSGRRPERLAPGRRYKVRIPLNYTAQRIPAGHRIRLSISTVYWPLAWLPPHPVKLTVWTGASRLLLPLRPPAPEDGNIDFGEPKAAPRPRLSQIAPPNHAWTVQQDLATQRSVLQVIDDRGTMRLDDIGLTVSASACETYSARAGDVGSARGETVWLRSLARDGWRISTRARTSLHSDADYFYIDAELDAFEGEARIWSQNWSEKIPRDHV